MPEQKLTKREKKAAAFRNRKKDSGALSEANAVPESDIKEDHQVSVTEQKPDRSSSKRANDDAQQDKPAKKKRRSRGGKGNKEGGDKKRFILFVGNLPKDTTSQELAAHFESVGEVPTVRLMTHKDTNEPKGFAFVEFNDSETLNGALALHRSKFKRKQINVELTAGGGGKGQARKDKLKEKNDRLQKERQANHKKGTNKEPASSYANPDE
ncbi:RNA-binding domain-containing protein [Lichtheimia hyalospora FSU 10163]|nr:RNA-binding domain-containing protein [Lichtheimia hyalospora FSU 10163]